MNDITGWAFVGIATAVVLWQVVSGEILTRGVPSIRITREESPASFWAAIIVQLIVLGIFGIAVYPHFAKSNR